MKAALVDIKSFALLLFVSLLLALFDLRGALNLPKAQVQYVSSPIQFGLYNSYQLVNKQIQVLIHSRTAAQENKALRSQIDSILSENAMLRTKLSTLEAFAAQEQQLGSKNFHTVPARPIGLDRYLRINKGQESGIKVGQAVIVQDNLIGEIINTSAQQSEVRLVTDPDSKIAAVVINESGRAKGLLQGQFGSEMYLEKILHQEPVMENDLVYTEGSEGRFAKGLILGQVLSIDEKSNDVFKQAKVKAVFRVEDLDVVFVVTE